MTYLQGACSYRRGRGGGGKEEEEEEEEVEEEEEEEVEEEEKGRTKDDEEEAEEEAEDDDDDDEEEKEADHVGLVVVVLKTPYVAEVARGAARVADRRLAAVARARPAGARGDGLVAALAVVRHDQGCGRGVLGGRG